MNVKCSIFKRSGTDTFGLVFYICAFRVKDIVYTRSIRWSAPAAVPVDRRTVTLARNTILRENFFPRFRFGMNFSIISCTVWTHDSIFNYPILPSRYEFNLRLLPTLYKYLRATDIVLFLIVNRIRLIEKFETLQCNILFAGDDVMTRIWYKQCLGISRHYVHWAMMMIIIVKTHNTCSILWRAVQCNPSIMSLSCFCNWFVRNTITKRTKLSTRHSVFTVLSDAPLISRIWFYNFSFLNLLINK